MASKKLARNVLGYAWTTPARLVSIAPRISFAHDQSQSRVKAPIHRCLHTTRSVFAGPTTTSATAEAVTTPQAQPPPEEDPDPAKHAAFLGEADSNDGFEAFKDAHGDPLPALDATNSAFLGEADSDDGFESRKDVDGEKLEAVDATNAAFLGEADSDDGFVAHRDAHPEDGDHRIENPEESGLHGQPGELDR